MYKFNLVSKSDCERAFAFVCPHYICCQFKDKEQYMIINVRVHWWYWLLFGNQLAKHLNKVFAGHFPINRQFIIAVSH